MPDKAHVNLGTPETAHISEIPELFTAEEMISIGLNPVSKFKIAGPDRIRSTIVQSLAELLLQSATQLYNVSLTERNVYEQKTAVVVGI